MCSVVGDWEVVMIELFQEQGDLWDPTPGNKLHDRETLLSRRVQECKDDYESAVRCINQQQNDVFSRQLPLVMCIVFYEIYN